MARKSKTASEDVDQESGDDLATSTSDMASPGRRPSRRAAAKKATYSAPSDSEEDDFEDENSEGEAFAEAESDDDFGGEESDEGENDDGDDDDDFEEEAPKPKGGKKGKASPKGTKRKAPATPAKKSPKKAKTATASKKATTTKAAKGGAGAGKKKASDKPPEIKNQKEAEGMILEFMRKENRPYNTLMVVDALRGVVKKTLAQKCMDALADRGELLCKEYNKQKIYLIEQSQFVIPTSEEAAAVNAEIASLKEQLAQLEATKGELTGQVRALTSAKYTKDLRTELNELNAANEKLEERVRWLKEEGTPIDAATVKKMYDDKERIRKLYVKRKRMCMDILDQMAEGMDVKVSKLMDTIGMEKEQDIPSK